MAAPLCLGVIDAAPAAQGCIAVRYYEMQCEAGDEPYRYEVHIKPAHLGVLTAEEINDGTYYARSWFHPSTGVSPEPESPALPRIQKVLVAFEPYVLNGDNWHLFTNQQYWIAVRAVAIDAADVVYEDDNTEQTLSYSSGYQGVQWMHIVSWPCIEVCDGVLKIQVEGSLPPITLGTAAELNVLLRDLPRNFDVALRKGD